MIAVEVVVLRVTLRCANWEREIAFNLVVAGIVLLLELLVFKIVPWLEYFTA